MAPRPRKRPVIGKGAGPKRQKGHPRPVVPFRPPQDLEEYLNDANAKGNPKTDVIVKALRLGRDAAAELGAEWWEVERRANVEQVSVGAMVGRLVLSALNAERKHKKP